MGWLKCGISGAEIALTHLELTCLKFMVLPSSPVAWPLEQDLRITHVVCLT